MNLTSTTFESFDENLIGIGNRRSAAVVRSLHDDVIKWKHFPRYWPFVRGIHRSPVNSQHKGQWRGALMFSLICTWINGWVNNGEAGDLRRHRGHHDVNVMGTISSYNPKIRRSVAAYVAAQRDLTRCWHCHKSLKKKPPCRPEWNFEIFYVAPTQFQSRVAPKVSIRFISNFQIIKTNMQFMHLLNIIEIEQMWYIYSCVWEKRP